MARFDRCDSCGEPYLEKVWPRKCDCGNIVWNNPIPVSCVIQPVIAEGRIGYLVGRRGIKHDPGFNKFAFPGGFLEDEDVHVGGAREVMEEMGLDIDPTGLAPVYYGSSFPKPNRVLLFGYARPVALQQIQPKLRLTPETLEIGLIFGTGSLEEIFCFQVHINAARHVITGPRGLAHHDYMKVL
jgi:ADP-ribose pyrophosphatase YjhB (NUDIX family)